MQTITKFLAVIALGLSVQVANAQETLQDSTKIKKIEYLKKLKTIVEKEERDLLKEEVENINQRLEDGKITMREGDSLKQEYAKIRALNIENRLAIIDNKIELVKRKSESSDLEDFDHDSSIYLRIGTDDETSDDFIYLGHRSDDKPKKYDKRTTSDLVMAVGFNNAIIDGEKLEDSPYKFAGSRFFEIGWAWKTRLLKESNFIRLKYGASLHINGLKPKDNQYFVQDGDVTYLDEFPEDLNKSKLTITNLVFPIHFEFGPSKKIERDTYFRYSTRNQFKIGFGGYGGFNIGTRQKLKYDLDGEKTKDKIKRSYNTSGLVYGLSGYVAFDDIALYVKYDLNPIFKDQAVDQNNISIGLRFDFD